MLLSHVMIRRCACIALAGLAVAVQSGPSGAEDQSRLIAAFYCPSDNIAFIGELLPPNVIVEDEKVRTELGLTNDQVERMRALETTFDTGVRGVLSGTDEKSHAVREGGGPNEMHVVAVGKITEELRKKSNEILKRAQLVRMQEIMLQLYGMLFIPKKDLQQILKLEQKQERAIAEIKSRIFRKIDETAAPDRVTAGAGGCKFATRIIPDSTNLLAESEESLYLLLNPEQKNVIAKLKGTPFIH